MNMPNPSPAALAPALRAFAAAPHRLLFFVGASNVLLAMAWWTLWLINARWHWFTMPTSSQPAGWMHAIVMQYQVLPPFMFGFLLTVFPRWMNLPGLTRGHYLPVGFGLLAGQALTLAAWFGAPVALLHAGVVLTLAGWAIGLYLLADLLWRAKERIGHAISCVLALTLGLVGLLLFAVYLHHIDPRLVFATIKIGSFGLLLPIFFTVCHRMVPFFSSVVVKDYVVWRPNWILVAFWALILAHLALELVHGYAWLWLVDLPLLTLFAHVLWRWWPRAAMPPILRVLYIGLSWLPIAFALYALQSAVYAYTGHFAFGRAPAHALFVGCFGSLLVAMVTRVSQGHSGRPLVLGAVGAFAFIVVQVTAIVRVLSDVLPDALAWQAIAGIGWVLAFLPWTLRYTWIYLTPRADGKPG